MNKQGIMVLCKDLQSQGIRKLWYHVKSSNLVHGVSGETQQRKDCLREDLKDSKVQAREEIPEVLHMDGCNVDQEVKPSPAQRRNKTLTAQHFRPTLCFPQR